MFGNLALIVASITTFLGFYFDKSTLWLPVTVFRASVFDLLTRKWVMSERLGSSKTLSMFLKSLCSLVIIYATIGQIICVWLVIKWFIL